MEVRVTYYNKRKLYIIDDLNRQLIRLSNKARFIRMCLDGTIDLRRKTNDQIDELMEGYEFAEIDDCYDYLVKIPMNSVSVENAEKILKEETEKRRELEILIGTSVQQMWLNDLAEFDVEYQKYKKMRELNDGNVVTENVVVKKGLKKKTT
jgi:DNA topoisomerase-2